jgi:hypothetical protein
MAQIVLELGHGGQSKAERELGWNRELTIDLLNQLTSQFTL